MIDDLLYAKVEERVLLGLTVDPFTLRKMLVPILDEKNMMHIIRDEPGILGHKDSLKDIISVVDIIYV